MGCDHDKVTNKENNLHLQAASCALQLDTDNENFMSRLELDELDEIVENGGNE